MKPIKILRLNRKHLSQMTYYFTSFQDNSCSHDGQSSICRIHSMQYIPVTPNMRDYNLLDSLVSHLIWNGFWIMQCYMVPLT